MGLDGKISINYKSFRICEITSHYKDLLFAHNEIKEGDNLTISDYLDFKVYKGGENIYCDLVVYIDHSDKPYQLNFYSKDNHAGMKNIINDIVNQS
jgi:hypothetical protein